MNCGRFFVISTSYKKIKCLQYNIGDTKFIKSKFRYGNKKKGNKLWMEERPKVCIEEKTTKIKPNKEESDEVKCKTNKKK